MVSLFPCWSETFILREILALRARGVRVRIFSLKPPSETLVHDAAKSLASEVIYPPSLWRLPGAVIRSFTEQPGHVSRLLWWAGRAARPFGVNEVAKAVFTVLTAAHFARRARQLGIAHFHAHWATYPALAVRTIQALAGIPYTLTTHAHDIFLSNPYLVENLSTARKVVTISEYNRRFLIESGTPAEKIAVIRCGLDFHEFSTTAPRSPRPGTIVSIGRLDPIKGFSHLIDACRLLHERHLAFSCEIIGEGPLRSQLEARIRSRGLQDRVRLLGAVGQPQVREILSSAEIFVLPSVRTADGNQDGIPVALMEAMALGLPVLSTWVSGIPELIINEDSGLLVPPASASALAEGMERLLRNAELRARLAAEGRRRVRARHDILRSAEQLQSVFGEMLHAA
jgi:glycosyltransferase involved in cell wall biosynthesis